MKAVRDRIQTSIDDALTFAEESPEPSPDDLYKYIFAED
jgi:pyruvate dehydrogenase E1 component alpha subunit